MNILLEVPPECHTKMVKKLVGYHNSVTVFNIILTWYVTLAAVSFETFKANLLLQDFFCNSVNARMLTPEAIFPFSPFVFCRVTSTLNILLYKFFFFVFFLCKFWHDGHRHWRITGLQGRVAHFGRPSPPHTTFRH